MDVFLQLLLALLFGTLCADQARKRGRHSTVWFFLGALFNLFALATLYILPSLFQGVELQEEKGGWGPADGNRSDSTSPGLSSGLSRSTGSSSGVSSSVETTVEPYVGDPRCRKWFFIDQTRLTQGPVAFRNLHTAWDQKQLSEESYVWTEGMPEWRPIRAIPTLFEQLQIFS